MTDRSMFSDTEWDLLVRLPRWVSAAASAAQPDKGRRAHTEEELGFVAIADGRELGSPFVADVARSLMDTYDEPSPTGPTIDATNPETGIAGVLESAQHAVRLLDSKADTTDASMYRHWLLTITDAVIGASRSGAVLGMGGDSVTTAERQFRDRLGQAIAG